LRNFFLGSETIAISASPIEKEMKAAKKPLSSSAASPELTLA
jgi:hypothetical protein